MTMTTEEIRNYFYGTKEELISGLFDSYNYKKGDNITYTIAGSKIVRYATSNKTLYRAIVDFKTMHRLLGADGVEMLKEHDSMIGRLYYLYTLMYNFTEPKFDNDVLDMIPPTKDVIDYIKDVIAELSKEYKIKEQW